jgi:outer membrane protein
VKNNSLIFNGLLAVAVLALYILYFLGNNNSIATTNKTAGSNTTVAKNSAKNTSGETKIAFVNTDTLLAKYDFAKTTRKDLDTKGRLIESDLRNRQGNLQNAVISFQNSAATMTQQKIEETRQSLAMKEQELRQYQQSQELEFAKEEQKLMEKLRDNLNEFVKKYAEANGYTYVLAYSKANPGVGLMYGVPTSDITEEVLKGLNEEYKEGQKKK